MFVGLFVCVRLSVPVCQSVCPSVGPSVRLSYACLCVRVDRRMDGWLDGWMDGWIIGWIIGWMDGWMDGWMRRVSARTRAHRHSGLSRSLLQQRPFSGTTPRLVAACCNSRVWCLAPSMPFSRTFTQLALDSRPPTALLGDVLDYTSSVVARKSEISERGVLGVAVVVRLEEIRVEALM